MKPVDSLKTAKPISSLDEIDTEEERKFINRLKKPFKKIKAKIIKTRENVPPLQEWWLILKRGTLGWFRDVGDRFKMRFDMAINQAIKIFVKTYGLYLLIIVLVFIAIYLLKK